MPPLSIDEPTPPKVYSIRGDFLWNVEDHVLELEFEMPGVKTDEVDIALGRDPYSQAVQLHVQGRSSPRLDKAPGSRMQLKRERLYGNFKRVINVPPTTTVRRHSAVISWSLDTRCEPLVGRQCKSYFG